MATACSLPPLVLLLLLVALPLSSAAIRPPPQVGRFVVKAVRSIIKKSTKEYLEGRAKDSVQDFSIQGNTGKGNNGQLGSSAADKFGAFLFDLSIGTSSSPQTLSLVLDITSELVWAQCDVLKKTDTFLQIGCDDQKCKDVFPVDNCARNNPVDDCATDLGRPCCGYDLTFYGGGGTKGNLATETFTFDSTSVPALVFGCSDSDTVLNDLDSDTGSRASGFAGFSMAPLSLVSQLQISSFSYFIALPDDPDNDKQSFVSWGDATAKGGHGTPLLVPTPSQNPYWYYVKLTGVQVDGQLLSDIPVGTFDVKTDGGGGVFLSTTLPVTYLEQDAYKVLRRELVSKIQSKGVTPTNPDDENHLCFDKQAFADKEVPKLALVFDGADAVMELKVQNYFFTLDDGMTCLTILPSIGGSVLGSLLQTGRTMTYDLQDGGRMLTFDTFETVAAVPAPAIETAAAVPAPAKVQLMIMATLLLWVLL